MRRPSLVVFVLGFVLVVAWAQVLGCEDLFTEKGDRLAEETLELAGYGMILMGVIEEWVAHWRGRV